MDEFETLFKLPSVKNYTQKERYSDFRKVFNTPEGQRVLAEILTWCHMLNPSILTAPIDPNLTHMKEGERNIGLKLLYTYRNEPPEQPQRTRRKHA